MSLTVSAALVFMFGTLLGSFLNVVIYLLPRELSLVAPGSRCPHCQTPIRSHANIPLLNFLPARTVPGPCGVPID